MISPNDLRCGNVIIHKGKFIIVESIDPLKEYEDLKCSIGIKEWLTDKQYTYTSVWLSNCNPIPLTEDILIKCGFQEDEYDEGIFTFQYGRHSFRLWRENEEDDFGVKYQCDIGLSYLPLSINMPFNYIHHLQNLFFCLIGEELKIEL